MIIEKRLEGKMGRNYIERISKEDRKHGINSMGNLALRNAYGEILHRDEKTGKECPVICGHGGSMWLCRACKDTILKKYYFHNPQEIKQTNTGKK